MSRARLLSVATLALVSPGDVDPPADLPPVIVAGPTLALGDYDGDGRLDAYAIYASGEDRLWRNAGDGTFEDVTAQSGLGGSLASRAAQWIDYDRDGRLDLYVSAARADRRLFRNVEGRWFEDATATAGLAGLADELEAHWVDLDEDGDLDLHVRTARGDALFGNDGRGALQPIDLGAVVAELAAGAPGERSPEAAAERAAASPRIPGAAPISTRASAPRVGAAREPVPAPTADLSAGGTTIGHASPGGSHAPIGNLCMPEITDSATDTCIRASSVPMLGKLYPMSDKLFVDAASGNVGIGTTNPAVLLHLEGPSNPRIRVDSSDGSGTELHLALAGTNRASLIANSTNTYLDSGPGSVLQLRAEGNAGMSILPGGTVSIPSGSLGVGTASPTTPLHVSATTQEMARLESTTNVARLVLEGAVETQITTSLNSANKQLTIIGGIEGGFAAGATLTVAGANHEIFGTGTGTATLAGFGASGDVLLRTNAANRVIVDQSGRVGIGTMSPVGMLSVAGSADVATTLGVGTTAPLRPLHVVADDDLARFEGTSGHLDIVSTASSESMLSTDGSGPLSVRTAAGTGPAQVTIDTLGRVAIGTGVSPANALSVAGAVDLTGWLGVGTAVPTAPLDVRGGTLWTTWNKAVELDDGSALKWRGSAAGWRHGLVQGANGLEIIRAQVDDGSAAHQKTMLIHNDGRISIGTSDAGSARLMVSPDGNVTNFAPSQIALSGAGHQAISVNTVVAGSAGLFLHNAGANAWRVSADRDSDDFVIANDSAGLAWQGPALVTVKDNGDVGIGTTTPLAKLDVDGTTRTQCVTITGGCDIVEGFETGGETCEPGSVLVIDAARPGELAPSSRPYDKRVAGVVSGAGGVRPGLALTQEGTLDGGTPVAMAGRVYVRCTAENGAIEPGDRLTSSSLAGHAMKATDRERCDGAVLGKAMSSLADGTGLVLVLVNLQ